MSKQIDFNDLIYYFKSKDTAPINLHTYNNIKNGDISIKNVEENQEHFKSNEHEITRGNPKNKPKDQLNTIKNIKNVYESRKRL